MKNILFIIFILGATFAGNAQVKQDLKRADMYFERAFYSEAIPIYESVSKKMRNEAIVKNLGDSYYNINNMGKASRVYKYLVENYSGKIDSEYYFKYAHTLKALNNYEEAYKVMRDFYSKTNNEDELKKLEASIIYLENVKALGKRYKIENLNINTENSEFGAIRYGDKLIFSASKKGDNFLDKVYKWDNQHYLDLYEVPIGNIHSGDSVVKSLPGEINTKLHEANTTFTKDGKTVYFTRNNYVKGKRKKDDDEITHLQLYKAEFIEGEWKNSIALHFNNDDYSCEHPALSPDGKTLYFVSDMPGGYGSLDIYSVSINNDGSFGNPKNLGETINTDKKEQFPYISNNNKLYFSSNGHPGFGSLDVFVSTINGPEFSKPDNVGLPINSGYDDFSFNINSDTKEGYFASNRPGGNGNDDIYQIIEDKPLIIEECKQFISGVITDQNTKEVLANTTITLKDNNNVEIESTYTDTEGRFKFNAECQMSYIVMATKEEYTSNQKVLVLESERNKDNDASMTLKSLELRRKEEALALAQQKIKEQTQKIEAIAQVQQDKKKLADEAVAKEKEIIKDKDQIVIQTGDIFFDYNLWYIRRDVKITLDKVIVLMRKYPEMKVEVGTHTDSRGNARYNLELSEKRANSVRDYIVKNNINPDRIFAKGYGETQPIIYCKTDETCSEEQHEINRRCEFIVKGF